MRAAGGPRNAQAYRLGISVDLGQFGGMEDQNDQRRFWPLWLRVTEKAMIWAVALAIMIPFTLFIARPLAHFAGNQVRVLLGSPQK